MNSAVKVIASIYNVNTVMLVNSFKDVNLQTARKWPDKNVNSMLFVALHLVDAHYFVLKQPGMIRKLFGFPPVEY